MGPTHLLDDLLDQRAEVQVTARLPLPGLLIRLLRYFLGPLLLALFLLLAFVCLCLRFALSLGCCALLGRSLILSNIGLDQSPITGRKMVDRFALSRIRFM